MITVSFTTFFVNWYNNRHLPLIRQFFLIPNGINEFVVRRQQCFTSCFNQFCWNLITTWWFIRVLLFAIAISTSRRLEPGTNRSAVCICIYLTALCIFNNWKSTSTYLKCCGNLQADHHSRTWLVASIKLIYFSIQVSDVLLLTVRCKLINFAFQIFPLYSLESFPKYY
jgi:hypothetical protein